MQESIAEHYLTNAICSIPSAPDVLRENTSVNEINLTESLLTPGLQTSITIQREINTNYKYNLDDFYRKTIEIFAERKILNDPYIWGSKKNWKYQFFTEQLIYRLEKRERINYGVEELVIQACDPSLIKDASTWVNMSFSCTTPSDVFTTIMKRCLNIKSDALEVEPSRPNRPYIAENIHPFQVALQQAEVALDSQMDPSFLHFMTYQNTKGVDKPTHNFRSLTAMAKQEPCFDDFEYGGKASTDINYANPTDIMRFSYPCDFDLLADTLNRIAIDGSILTSIRTVNPALGFSDLIGVKGGCGTTPYIAYTNKGTEEEQETCATNVEVHLLKRKPRISILDQDKIALKMIVPFNPNLNAGKVIVANFRNPYDGEKLYSSGKYLIVNLNHNLKLGGLGTTSIDCVAKTGALGSTIDTTKLGTERF